MLTEIFVEDAFAESAGKQTWFVLLCQVNKGQVRGGMTMSLPVNAGLDMVISIDELEVIDAQRDAQRIKIKVYCEDAQELEFLLSLQLSDEILSIE